ncbi:E3 ubiquitin-protein ligase PRT1-like isoform X1 [Selaginella moellendorffii]|uniref:E3 ubiquitin-protein ligase PRT1-like isoform X1 n=1 Tax=Selaginella moellendorffii TaxID=88036 RepID=UPI000D1D01E6|nr:E3 ubiquitin-protein ligase PRT1-like isoform X1 [Selaginella moellendorffii]|eukprot:XP_024532531.1 E3 ubiquitin-protein ligase PRT1-like isoform X1 [Selaginella moellendorffii]
MEMDAYAALDPKALEDWPHFQCAMCLELCFKPIVQACGHFFCFWCVDYAMNGSGPSRCPMCRCEYTQFPRICGLLHRLLGAAFREAYEERRKEILEMESEMEYFSPEEVMEKSIDGAIEASDLPCELCKELIYRPVVLNCGHAFCQSCLRAPVEGESPKCPSCGMPQRIFPVQVCLELNEYIQKTFPAEYKQREDKLKEVETTEASTRASSSTCSRSSSSKDGSNKQACHVHRGAGCDGCGVLPIIGSRYKCIDCPEKVGYDLCGDCYPTSAAPVGRFNQRHTAEHRMEEVRDCFTTSEIYSATSL